MITPPLMNFSKIEDFTKGGFGYRGSRAALAPRAPWLNIVIQKSVGVFFINAVLELGIADINLHTLGD